MNQSRILPFYMAYPLPMYYQQEDTVIRDLEYLQQMYPTEAKKYQKIIAEVLDRLDYDGSMIYDEYPDKWQMYRLTQLIVDKIRKQKETDQAAAMSDIPDSRMNYETDGNRKPGMENSSEKGSDMDWDWITEFIQVLLFYEIYKKRHTNRNGILKF